MDERNQVVVSHRKKDSYWKHGPDFGPCRNGKSASGKQGNVNLNGTDVKTETFAGKDPVQEFQYGSGDAETDLTKSPKYSRVLSEPNLLFEPSSDSPRLKRALSATEIKTRLVCPKGLLISTEPPKSGQSYRRRSNSELFVPLRTGRQNSDALNNRSGKNLILEKGVVKKTQETELILFELESVKHERFLLQKENERLRKELENRNKVIDHLIDYMKSNLSQEIGNFEDIGDAKTSSYAHKMDSSSNI